MAFDVVTFSDGQKTILKVLTADSAVDVAYVALTVLYEVLNELIPDWERDPQAFSPRLRSDVEACMAAFAYASTRAMLQDEDVVAELAATDTRESDASEM